MVTHEVATTADMIWAELLKESQHGLNSIENSFDLEHANEAGLHRLHCY